MMNTPLTKHGLANGPMLLLQLVGQPPGNHRKPSITPIKLHIFELNTLTICGTESSQVC